MRLARIYQNSKLNVGQSAQLDSRAHNHIVNVLRSKPGDNLILFDGSGQEYNCIIASCNKKQTIIKVIAAFSPQMESSLKIHLGQAISNGDRMDFAIQKSVELGVTEITPLKTDFCGFKLSEERLEKKINHWQQVAISACEQCQRNIIPNIYQPVDLKTWITDTNADLKLIFDPGEETPIASLTRPKTIALAIGPEGGFSEIEILTAEKNAFTKTTLGPRVLRTETAPITAISIFQYLWGDLGNF